MEFKAHIEKLQGSANWTKWKRQIELLLRHNDVLDLTVGDRTRPLALTAASADELSSNEKKIKSFMKDDALAQLILVGNMDDNNIELTATCDSANSIWLKLLSVYEQSSGQRVDRLMESFFRSEKDAEEDIVTHIAKLQRNFSELNDELNRVAKTTLPDLLLMSRIMSTLPAEYFEFKSVWESVPIEERTVNKLTERLRLIEMRLPPKQSDCTALVVSKKKVYNKKERKCYVCKKTGHIAKDCFKKVPKNKSDGDAFICIVKGVPESEVWLADSGATSHMTKYKEYFTSFEPFVPPRKVFVGNSEAILAYGQGTVNVEMKINGRWDRNYLSEVWYVPDISKNLFSIGQTLSKNFDFKATKGACFFMKDNIVRLKGIQTAQGLYALEMRVRKPDVSAEVYVAHAYNSMQLWHERLCHQGEAHVKDILSKYGVEITTREDELCEGCCFGKQCRKPFGTRKQRPVTPGELIHADVCGPMQQTSLGGARYFLCFKDDFSKYRRVFFLKSKDEVPKCLQIFLNEAKNSGHTIKEFLSDGGREFQNLRVKNILQQEGISFRISMPYTPEQNGAAERENRTLVESARCMIHARGLPLKLWAEAINTVTYVLNRYGPTPTKSKSPFELWFRKDVQSIDHLHVFGTECYVHVPKQKRRKWDKKSEKGIFVGYSGEKDGFRIWIKNKDTVILSRDVIFDCENINYVLENSSDQSPEQVIEIHRKTCDVPGEDTNDADLREAEASTSGEDTQQVRDVVGDQDGAGNTSVKLRDRAKLKKPEKFENFVLVAECDVPDSYASAVNSEYGRDWQSAMNEEMASITENKVWHLVDLPPGKKLISNRWVFKVKTKPNGNVDRFKARLVARGYSQKQGIDYDETFSPVARFDTVRTVLSVAASENLQLLQFDIKTAFLYGEIQEEIYMHQPEGYNDGSGRVCRLDRSLYGLKQAPRCWNERFVNFIKDQGLTCSDADPCLFYRRHAGEKLLVVIYVDDGLVAGTSDCEVSNFVDRLKSEFKISIGSLESFLGMHIIKLNNGSVFVSQANYIKKILDKFRMSDANAVATPSEKTEPNDIELTEKVPYREAVGSLMYLSTATRPDIAYAVSIVSENLDSPLLSHWQAVKRIFKYLKGTIHHGLLYCASSIPGELETYSDADYAGDIKTRRSRTGVVCKYANGAITWQSQKQKSVVLSTTEAEYVAANEATKEIIWLKRLLGEITSLRGIPTLRVDNASAIKLAKNPEFHKRSKHVEVRFHFIREKYQEKVLNIKHIEGSDQVADIMTKPLARALFEKHRDALGQIEFKL